jgi:hypothetical protein
MTPSPGASNAPMACAAVEALLAARWECMELLSRRPPQMAADLLRGRAAELAASAFATDQVLSLALETAASDLDAGSPPLEGGALFLLCDAEAVAQGRLAIRTTVLRQTGEPSPAAARLVAELEHRLAGHQLTPAALARRMAAEARLQEALWDDPRLPASTAVRLAMLNSVPDLTARAAELDRGASRAARKIATRASGHRSLLTAKRVHRREPAASDGLRWSSIHAWWLLAAATLVIVAMLIAPPGGPLAN